MNLIEIIKHNNQLILNKEVSLAEVYGKENFCYLIYSLIKMQKPETIIELGTGLGTTALMIAQALKENNKGKIWTVDNGKDWEETKTSWIKTKFKTHEDYFNDVIKKFKLKKYIELLNIDLDNNLFIDTGRKIDLVFCDATDAGAMGCINLLKAYLPNMNTESSIFIDRASTINHSFLLLEKVINDLQNNKIPNILLNGLNKDDENNFIKFVSKSKFTLIHLTEKNDQKKNNKMQNSTAWIKIEPVDVFFQKNVYNVIL